MATNDKKKESEEFSTPEKVQACIYQCQQIEDRRALDRSRINVLFNGGRPYSSEEEAKYQIAINVNFGQGKKIARDAKSQMNNATLHDGHLFTATTDSGPVDKRDEWGQIVTDAMHDLIQQNESGKKFFYMMNDRNGAVVLHGIGPVLWPTDFCWMPRFVPLEDLLIPTDTFSSFSNLRYFAVNLYLSPGEFQDMTQGDMVKKGWDKEACRKILEAQKEITSESMPSSWRDQPESLREVFKQNQGYYYSDAIPKIRLRAFYFQSIDDPKKWYRRVLPRETYSDVNANTFLYNSDEVFATSINQILQITYGDLSLVSPSKYHSTRGIGVELYAPVEITNRLQCEFVQSIFESMKMYFRIQNPADRDRLKQVVLQQFGFIPEGLQIVGRNDRHQIDPNLVEMGLGQMRQYMQENSSSFVRDADAGSSSREMTAKEAMIRVNQANMLVSSMMSSIYLQEGFFYTEIKRRLFNSDSRDPEVKAFREACIKKGVPKDMMVADKWRVAPERVLGGGDQTIADGQAQWLYQNRTAYSPKSQITIMRTATATVLRSWDKAKNLVPLEPPTSTKGSQTAEDLFATLMSGIQCAIREGMDYEGYIGKLLASSDATIQRIEQSGNMATMPEIIGLGTVLQNVSQYVQVMGQDDAKKQLVKQIQDIMGQQENKLKGFAQRLQEQQQEQQGDPETEAKVAAITATTQAKIQSQMATTSAKLQSKQAADMQKLHQKEVAFDQKSRQGMVSHGLKSAQTVAQTKQDIATKQALTISDIQAKQTVAENQPEKKTTE